MTGLRLTLEQFNSGNCFDSSFPATSIFWIKFEFRLFLSFDKVFNGIKRYYVFCIWFIIIEQELLLSLFCESFLQHSFGFNFKYILAIFIYCLVMRRISVATFNRRWIIGSWLVIWWVYSNEILIRFVSFLYTCQLILNNIDIFVVHAIKCINFKFKILI